MIKIYELKNLSGAELDTTFCGYTIHLSFRSNNRFADSGRASLITSDRFVQDAIEADSRYGYMFTLAEVLDEPKASGKAEEPKAEEQDNGFQEIESVKSFAEGVAFFANMGMVVKSKRQLRELADMNKVSFPNYDFK